MTAKELCCHERDEARVSAERKAAHTKAAKARRAIKMRDETIELMRLERKEDRENEHQTTVETQAKIAEMEREKDLRSK
jgi:hypothetical protein